MNPYVEKVYSAKMEKSHNTHHSVVNSFCDIARSMDR